jgi:hypothetical protein
MPRIVIVIITLINITTIDDVQNCDSYINMPSLQTYSIVKVPRSLSLQEHYGFDFSITQLWVCSSYENSFKFICDNKFLVQRLCLDTEKSQTQALRICTYIPLNSNLFHEIQKIVNWLCLGL